MGTKRANYGAPPTPGVAPDYHTQGSLPHYGTAPAPRLQVPLPGYDASMTGAPNQIINVAHEPVDPSCGCTPGNCSCGPSCGCMCCWGNGPGGKTTIRQYNEKGILESGLHHLIEMGTVSEIYHEHDQYMQGIYAEPAADEAFEHKAGWGGGHGMSY